MYLVRKEENCNEYKTDAVAELRELRRKLALERGSTGEEQLNRYDRLECEAEVDKSVELIARFDPDRVKYGYANVMYNVSDLTDDDIMAGKGRDNSYLYSTKDAMLHTKRDKEFFLSSEQLFAIEKEAGDDAYYDRDGTKFVPFRALVSTYGADSKYRGVEIVTDTIAKSDLGKLSECDINKQYQNMAKCEERGLLKSRLRRLQQAIDMLPPGGGGHGGHGGSDGEQKE